MSTADSTIGATAALDRPAHRPATARLATTRLWTLTTLVLALAASILGLLVVGVYQGEPVASAAMLRAYDLVNLAVILPLLAGAAFMARRGSPSPQLVSASLVAYLLYTYAYYLFGTGFNVLLPLHAAVVASGLVTLTAQLAGLDVEALGGRVRAGRAHRGAAVVLGLLALALGGMWIYFALHHAVTGVVPAGSQLVETDGIVHLGMVLDLSLLVPLYSAAALLLARRSPWGYVLGVIAVIAGVLHQVSYLVAMPFQVAAGVPGAVAFDPGEPVIVALYVLGGVLLFWPRSQRRAAREERGVSTSSTGGASLAR